MVAWTKSLLDDTMMCFPRRRAGSPNHYRFLCRLCMEPLLIQAPQPTTNEDTLRKSHLIHTHPVLMDATAEELTVLMETNETTFTTEEREGMHVPATDSLEEWQRSKNMWVKMVRLRSEMELRARETGRVEGYHAMMEAMAEESD